jgi:hypothetical protein
MSMKICKECGAEISKSAKVCPKCGKKQKGSLLLLLVAVILIISTISIFVGALSGTTSTNSSTEAVVTKENYEKIEEGMTIEEVVAILGEPRSTSENEITGLGKTILYHYQESFTLTGIDIYFHNGTVYMKNWTDL